MSHVMQEQSLHSSIAMQKLDRAGPHMLQFVCICSKGRVLEGISKVPTCGYGGGTQHRAHDSPYAESQS